MKVNELDTPDIKSMLSTMETQIINSEGDNKRFLQDYYKNLIEEAKQELIKRGNK